MDLKRILNRIRFFIITPAQEWENTANEKETNKELVLTYIVPVVLFSSIIIFAGRILNWEDHSVVNGTLAVLSFLLVTFLTIYLSAFIINELLPKFDTNKNLNRTFKLMIFSSLPVLVAYGISSFHPQMGFINFFSLYSIVLYWKGVQPLLGLSEDKITGFVLISLLIIGALLMIISSVIMSVIIYFSVY
ncbi:MAG TPA: Yip1 family protein [Bacteroidales bacterium]|nr:Yip1 family protein [Bacteroidales bacterium]